MVEPIVVDEEYRKEIEMARRELGVFITNNKCAPLMLQFAYLTLLNYCFHVFLANSLHCLRWNDAATYDAKSRRGGPNGSIRLRIGQELKHEANKGLENAVQYCACGAVAVEVTKGPTIDFVPGRKDSNESPRTEGRFIDGEEDARNLRKIFSRMGLSDEQDIVALCGGHTLIRTMYPKVPMGETHKDRSKFEEGKSTNKPLKFDNSYFKELLSKDASFSRLPMDYALVEDPKFHHCVERTHVKLTGTIGKRWTIVIDVAKETVTGVALDLGPLPLDSPVVDGFEEGAKLVLLLELELGGVRDGEGDGALVAGFEVEVWRVGMSGVKIQVGSALRTAVHGGHGSVGGNVNCEASFSAVRGITK
ncbi:hypothetical protein JHK84_030615 [Glycine max]|nr:hypothetical protein JHK85_031028 [Glycine max]KAG5145072.1 hypothetical protein JHK84_030615 [Glycine max]